MGKETEVLMTREEKARIEEEVEEGTCEFMHVHEAIVEKVERVMPDEQELRRESRSCMCSASLRCVSVTLRPFCKWDNRQSLISSEP